MEINRPNLLALINAGIKRNALSVSGLERDAGVPKDTVRDFLRGKTQVLRADKLQKILRVLEPDRNIPVKSTVNAKAEIVAIEPDGQKIDYVGTPPGYKPSDVVAFRITGDAMLPVFHDGWVLYYSPRNDIAPLPMKNGWQIPYAKPGKTGQDRFAEFLGKPCVIGLKNGKTMLGILKRSLKGNGYDIINHNASELHNITPEWAAKIIFIKTE